MRELLTNNKLRQASTDVISMLSEFIDINTLFVAINDGTTNYILTTRNQSEALVCEGSLPFFESYCSLVCQNNSFLVIQDTELHGTASTMNITRKLGATTFVGMPITLADGSTAGTVCGLDRNTFTFSKREIKLLEMASKFLATVIELENMAFRDKLTGAFTRNYLTDAFSQFVERHSVFAVCAVDADNFKSLNDTYGHLIGDQALKQMVESLQGGLSTNDVLVRLGGDEFLILIAEFGSVPELQQRLNILISKADKSFGLSISVGVSLYPHDGTSMKELTMVADMEMYKVKSQGKNNYSLSSTFGMAGL